MLDLPREERIRALLVDRWIDYPRATEALRRLHRLLETPQRERMPCMLLHGPSNIGKTLIMRKFLRSNPPTFDAARGVEHRPVIAMQMPPTPDQRRFYRALLSVIGAPQGANATLASLEQVARDLLLRMQPRMLILDEVHHLLAGSHREQRASLNLQVSGQRTQDQHRRNGHERRTGGLSHRRAGLQPLYAVRTSAMERIGGLPPSAERIRSVIAAEPTVPAYPAAARAVSVGRQRRVAR
jgi:hypothetical protein